MATISIRQPLRFTTTLLSNYSLIHYKFDFHSSSSTILNQSCNSLKQFHQIHALFITSGSLKIPSHADHIFKLADHVAGADINYTLLISRYIRFPDTFYVNTLIKVYSNSRVANGAMDFYFKMLSNGFCPNSYSFTFLINACAKSGSVELGQKCHGQIFKNGVELVLQVENSLIHMYGCIGLVKIAHKVFDEIVVKDLVSWNSIIDGYVKLGDFDYAHKLFDQMPDKNVISWNLLIGGYAKGGNPGCGLKLFREMMNIGVRRSNTTLVNVITACARSARLKEGRSIHGSLIKTLVKSNLIMDTALIDMYSKCGKVDVAHRVFDRMVDRNLVCWNAMILGHSISGDPEEGLNLFVEMVNCTVNPDEITFIGVLCACARASLLDKGRFYFQQMMDVYKLKPSFAHYWCMANLFEGVGLVQEAEEVIKSIGNTLHMSTQSLAIACLLGKCRFQGGTRVGEKIGNYLIVMEPENISGYALLLVVYSGAGQWEDVAKVRELMKEKVGRVIGCGLVDLKELVHNFRVDDGNLSLVSTSPIS